MEERAVERETTVEKIKVPTTTVIEGEPSGPGEVAPAEQPSEGDENKG